MMSDQDPAPVFPGVPELLFEPIVLLPALPGVSRFYDRRIQADHATPFLTENETIAAVPADKILHRFGRGFVPYVAGARQQINRDFRIDPAAQLPEPGQLGGVPAVVHQVPGNHHECGLQPVDRVDKLLELLFFPLETAVLTTKAQPRIAQLNEKERPVLSRGGKRKRKQHTKQKEYDTFHNPRRLNDDIQRIKKFYDRS